MGSSFNQSNHFICVFALAYTKSTQAALPLKLCPKGPHLPKQPTTPKLKVFLIVPLTKNMNECSCHFIINIRTTCTGTCINWSFLLYSINLISNTLRSFSASTFLGFDNIKWHHLYYILRSLRERSEIDFKIIAIGVEEGKIILVRKKRDRKSGGKVKQGCHLAFFETACQKLNGLAIWPLFGLFSFLRIWLFLKTVHGQIRHFKFLDLATLKLRALS